MFRSITARVALGIAALSTGLAWPARSAAQQPVDVYILAGQSNMTGQGVVANLQPGQVPDPRPKLYHSAVLQSSTAPFTWGPLRPASEAREKVGPEVSFGNRIQQRTKYRPVALIKHALTATNLAKDWAPGKDAADRAHWGSQFEILVGTVEAGLKSLREQGFTPTLRGMAWQQGESDADETEWAVAYAANLAHLIARVREQFAAPDLVFVYGFVLPPPCQGPMRDTIRTAQGAIDQDSGSPLAVRNAFVVYTDDLSHRATDPNSLHPKDHIHFGTAGAWELGRRMAEAMANKGKLGD